MPGSRALPNVREFRQIFRRCSGLLLGLWCAGVGSHLRTLADPPPAKTLARVRQYQAAQPFETARFDLSATVLFHDPASRLLILEDATAALTGIGPADQRPLEPGDQVLIQGTTKTNQLEIATILPSGDRIPLTPVRASLEEVTAERLACRLVELPATLRTVREFQGRLRLDALFEDELLEVTVLNYPATNFLHYVDARAVLRGVLGPAVLQNGQRFRRFWVQDWRQIRIERTADPFALSLTPIAQVANLDMGRASRQRVRVRGEVLRPSQPDRVVIADATGELQARLRYAEGTFFPGDRIELSGYPARASNRLALAYAVARWVANDQPSTPLPAAHVPSRFTEIAGIRRLKPDIAAKRIPVELTATVTYAHPSSYRWFVQDDSGGIYVSLRNWPEAKPGSRVRIQGKTGPGDFAPIIEADQIDIVGTGPLPPAKRVTASQLLTGQEDSQWVEIDGIVQEVSTNETLTLLTILGGNTRFTAEIPDLAALPRHLLDKRIRLQGAAGTHWNARRQMNGFLLSTPNLECVQILGEGASNPFQLPVTAIREIGQFSLDEGKGHRIRVSGIVTHHERGRFLFLEDGTGGVKIETKQLTTAVPGDVVEACGFPEAGRYSPSLRGGQFRVVRHESEPVPSPIQASQVLAPANEDEFYDYRLVEVEGAVMEHVRSATLNSIILSAQGAVFHCQLPAESAGDELVALRPGSQVRLKGICLLEVNEWQEPTGFSIALRSPADVTLLRSPSWWTARRTAGVVALLSMLTSAAFFWVRSLRSQVRAQTRLLERQYSREAALSAFSHQLSCVDNLADAARLILEKAIRLLPAEGARLETRSESGAGLETILTIPPDSARLRAALAWQPPSPLVPADQGGAPVVFDAAPLTGAASQAGVCVPIWHHRQLVGTILLLATPRAPVSPETLAALATLAERSSSALERIGAQQISHRNAERFRYAAKATNDVIWDWDLATHAVQWSEGIQAFLRCGPEAIRSEFSFWRERVHADDLAAVERSLDRVIEGKDSSWSAEYRLRREDGTYAYVLDRGYVLRENGRAVRMIGAMQDQTGRKDVERAMERARQAAEEASRAKSDFLATMSHEIRTPMNGVLGMTQLLLGTELTAEQKDLALTLRGSGEALLSIINDVLDFSKIEAGKMTLESVDFDLRPVVEETVNLLAARLDGRKLEIASFIPTEFRTEFRGDPVRLRQVLMNLVGNAVKFTESGEVFVNVSLAGEDEHSARVRVEVSDTGIGIHPEVLPKLFQAFTQADGSTTRRFGGTGLGLAICKRLIDAMGGQIEARSTQGRGSTFWFEVPLSKAPPMASAPAAPHLAGQRVLIVDDNATNRKILHHYARSWGLRDHSVDSGREVVALLEGATAAGDPFDLVLLDMQMPEMDGLTVAKAIQAARSLDGIRLVMLTSLGQKFPPEVLKEHGIAACLLKPLRPADLRQVLSQLPLEAKVPAAPAPVAPQAVPISESDRPKRLLLAEDHPVNRKLALMQLKKLGYEADVAENGLQALEAMKKQFYPLILMDCQMPEMDGFEATAQIRQIEASLQVRSPVRIIAMTANAMPGDRERCLKAGMDDYISKPVQINELQALLQRHLAAAAAAAEPAAVTSP